MPIAIIQENKNLKTFVFTTILNIKFGRWRYNYYLCSRNAASRVEELFVAQVLIKKVKLKCCGI